MSGNGRAAGPAVATAPTRARSAAKGDLTPPSFLDDDPPHWLARGLSTLVIVMTASAAVALVVVKVPETVTCPLLLVGQGTDPVRMPHDGFVTGVRVRESQTVGEGDVLFAIRADTVGDRSGELATATIQLEGARQSLVNAERRYERLRLADAEEDRRLVLHGDALARRAEGTNNVQVIRRRQNKTALEVIEQEIGSLAREKEFRGKARTFSLDAVERGTRLNLRNMISVQELSTLKLEAEKAGYELEKVSRDLASARSRAVQSRAEHESLEAEWGLKMEQLEADRKENASALARLRHQAGVAQSEYEEQRRGLRELVERSSTRIASLTGQLGQSTADQVIVKAPCPGVVLRLRVRASGAFVRTGDILCELAGTTGKVEAELTVPQLGLGRVVPGQEVKLLYDAFPYERYGVRYGRVRWVSPAGVAPVDTAPVAVKEGGPAFRALVDLDDPVVMVKGRPQSLLPGMGGKARVMVGRRSLISYAFEPLRQFREDMASPPQRPGP